MKETYSVKLRCMNCGWEGNVSEEKGTKLYEELIDCPNCKCRTLTRFIEKDYEN